jgi:hypothetical protein
LAWQASQTIFMFVSYGREKLRTASYDPQLRGTLEKNRIMWSGKRIM